MTEDKKTFNVVRIKEIVPMTFTAEQAAIWLGYDDALGFRRAVGRGVFSPPIDAEARPQRWSRLKLEQDLMQQQEMETTKEQPNYFDQKMFGAQA